MRDTQVNHISPDVHTDAEELNDGATQAGRNRFQPDAEGAVQYGRQRHHENQKAQWKKKGPHGSKAKTEGGKPQNQYGDQRAGKVAAGAQNGINGNQKQEKQHRQDAPVRIKTNGFDRFFFIPQKIYRDQRYEKSVGIVIVGQPHLDQRFQRHPVGNPEKQQQQGRLYADRIE